VAVYGGVVVMATICGCGLRKERRKKRKKEDR